MGDIIDFNEHKFKDAPVERDRVVIPCKEDRAELLEQLKEMYDSFNEGVATLVDSLEYDLRTKNLPIQEVKRIANVVGETSLNMLDACEALEEVLQDLTDVIEGDDGDGEDNQPGGDT